MHIYIISQSINKMPGVYTAAVVYSNNPRNARRTHPGPHMRHWDGTVGPVSNWVPSDAVECRRIGTAPRSARAGVVQAFRE